MNMLTRSIGVGFLFTTLTLGSASAADLADALDTLRAVGPKGAGNDAATVAWAEVVETDVSQLPEILAALKGANPLAANWIRTAIDAVCEHALRDHGDLPRKALEEFVLETSQDPKGRRLAYEWLLKVDTEAEARIVPKFLDDPSLELRREAIARLIDQGQKAAEAGSQEEALKSFEKAFTAARDRDQVDTLSKQLKKLGHEINLVEHDGLIVDWLVIGPFDNAEEAGFDKVYPPEEEFHPETEYEGKHGSIGWIPYRSESRVGKVDLYQGLAGSLVDISDKLHERDVVGYAVAEFHSPSDQNVQIRSSTMNAIKIWANGQLIDEHNVYHAGSQFDQYEADAKLRQGKNRILVKICQNAQTQSWTESLSFQLRVCDTIGGGILSLK